MTARVRYRHLVKWALLPIVAGTLVWLSVGLSSPGKLPLYDFIEYWAAGRLQLAGGNPYSPQQLFTLQQSIDWPYETPLMMWNPPWTLIFVMPFGLLDYGTSRVLWLWLEIAVVLMTAGWLWQLYGGPTYYRWIATLVAIAFFPTLLATTLGQISPLSLAGVVGFLYFERRQRWWLAGAATVLVAVKPHLLYLFWVALLLWILDQRRWPVLLSGGVAGLLATAIPMMFNPHVFAQYLHTASTEPPFYWATPTLGTLLRLVFGLNRHWLQFFPTTVGIIWFMFYWHRHRHTWNWSDQIALLLLVSVTTAPFRWTHDQVVLLPAVMQAGVWVSRSNRRSVTHSTLLAYALINGLAFSQNAVLHVNDFWRIWMAPTLLLCYLILHQQIQHRHLSAKLTSRTKVAVR